jgi:DNA-binding PucR family transcriptional regulator
MDPSQPPYTDHGGPVRALLASLLAEPEPLLRRIARDVGETEDRVERAVARHVELTSALSAVLAIAEDPQDSAEMPPPAVASVLARLRADAEAAASAGERLEHLLDRHLSTGWVLWEAANADPDANAPTLAALGSALLRAGDQAAAAIAAGHAAAERELIARRTALLREVVHELLDPAAAADLSSAAALARAAAAIGIDQGRDHRVVVASLGEAIDDADPRMARVVRAVARPPRAGQPADLLPIVSTRRGRIVFIDAVDRPSDMRIATALAAVGPGTWWAVASRPVARTAEMAAAAVEAFAALDAAARHAPSGLIVPVGSLALERALLADEALLRAAVEAELGPLLASARSGVELVETIDAFLAEGMSVTGTARRLHLAPRTVTYRLARIEALRGVPLDAAAWRRYAVALAGRELLEGAPGLAGSARSGTATPTD